ncbi:hypothetical protein [Stenotrophomonas sp.]|uniref:hypothetical protein n=1 Tax=Stenotrophomonas sp. TaxID=69392 RepID=UPI002D2B01A4|nr:hypothetical protein [Stenotrophomonas sp.]HYQ23580.1 hypothetical protein [Stenotrophomonas sp.]
MEAGGPFPGRSISLQFQGCRGERNTALTLMARACKEFVVGAGFSLKNQMDAYLFAESGGLISFERNEIQT